MKQVVLNPGHFPGKDPGAIGNGLNEADITVQLAYLIQNKSLQYNFETVIVHKNELSDICTKANQTNADLFISLHANSASNISATGFESFVYSIEAEKFRNIIHSKLASFLEYYGFPDRGMKTASFYVLKNTSMPAILTENLFISNSVDANKLKNEKFLNYLADIYCQGIAEALGIEGNEDMDKISIIINDKKIEGYLIDGTSYAPVRTLIDSLNRSVEWDETEKTVTIK